MPFVLFLLSDCVIALPRSVLLLLNLFLSFPIHGQISSLPSTDRRDVNKITLFHTRTEAEAYLEGEERKGGEIVCSDLPRKEINGAKTGPKRRLGLISHLEVYPEEKDYSQRKAEFRKHSLSR